MAAVVQVLVALRRPAPAAPEVLGGPYEAYISVNENANKRSNSSLVLRGAHINAIKE